MSKQEKREGMVPLERQEVEYAIWQGLKRTADAVASTLGPSGNPVIIGNSEGQVPIVTKDGVSVANLINITEPASAIGSQLVKIAANRTVMEAGDGTSTASIFTRDIYNLGRQLNKVKDQNIDLRPKLYYEMDEDRISQVQLNKVYIKRGMDKAVKMVHEYIDEMAIPCETKDEIHNVAFISTNSDKGLADVITEAVLETGSDGIVRYEKSKELTVELEILNGYKHDKPLQHETYMTHTDKAVLKNAVVLISSDPIETAEQITPYMEFAWIINKKPLVIVAPEIIGSARSMMENNVKQNKISGICVEASGFGDNMRQQLEDLAAYTGGQVFGEEAAGSMRLDETVEYNEDGNRFSIPKYSDALGVVSEVVSYPMNSEKGYTLFHQEKVNFDTIQRADIVRSQVESTNDGMIKRLLEARLSRLTGKVAMIKVGGESAIEVDERYDRVDDAVKAVKSAKKGGIVSGGGSAFIHAKIKLAEYIKENASSMEDNELIGFNIICECLSSPLQQIHSNCMGDDEEAYRKVVEEMYQGGTNYGFNANNSKVENLIEAGVIDPALVSKIALSSASSVASTALSAERFVLPEKIQE